MCTIRLQDLMSGLEYPDAGAAFYDKMLVLEKTCDRIVVDMDGVVSLPTIFLNVSIGKYLKQFGVDALKTRYSFAHISAAQAAKLQDYVRKMSEPAV